MISVLPCGDVAFPGPVLDRQRAAQACEQLIGLVRVTRATVAEVGQFLVELPGRVRIRAAVEQRGEFRRDRVVQRHPTEAPVEIPTCTDSAGDRRVELRNRARTLVFVRLPCTKNDRLSRTS